MLDVHPPHHAATTWRDFLIHIATIVLGLLIAVGLEQTIELIHHRDLANEAREQLRVERFDDERSNELNIFTSERHQRDLRHDLAILRAVRTHTPPPIGPFIVRRFRYVYPEDVGRRLHESGTINYLHDDLRGSDYRYSNQDRFMARVSESIQTLLQASSVLQGENDPPRASSQISIDSDRFLKAVVASHGMLPQAEVEQGYAMLEEHANLAKLKPTELDEVERAIKVALADEEALLTYCFNIQRVLKNHPGV
jgi:uncharacterized protein (DUF2267 family)